MSRFNVEFTNFMALNNRTEDFHEIQQETKSKEPESKNLSEAFERESKRKFTPPTNCSEHNSVNHTKDASSQLRDMHSCEDFLSSDEEDSGTDMFLNH